MAEGSSRFVIEEAELEKFKIAYCTAQGGKYNLEIQAPHLAKLADGYLNRYKTTEESSRNWTDLLKAHSLYNSVAARDIEDAEKRSKKIFEVQQTFWGDDAAWKYQTQQSVTLQLKESLEETREEIRSQLIPVEQLVNQLTSKKISESQFLEQFSRDIEQISINSTNNMVFLAKRVFEFSVSALIAQPPCAFCVVAFGSMAKGEATPYSDLEYLFLIEHTNPDIVKYFENLAISSYFVIGNFGETKLGYMDIAELEGWFDDKETNGFKIDGLQKGAGNIPTGNGSKSSKNFLIVTPNELLSMFKRVLDRPEESSKRGDLTAVLQYTKLVYCSEESSGKLLDTFCEGKNLLQSGPDRQEANRKMFIADAKKYSFKPTEKLINNGFSINTKIELYRYPSIVLYNLSILFGSNQGNSWETLRSLCTQHFISQSVHRSLSFLLACACYFRLSTYLLYNSADDRLSVLPPGYIAAADESRELYLSRDSRKIWFLPQDLFNLHCDYSIPLKSHIGMCSIDNIEVKIRDEIQEPNWLVKFQTYHCCNRWSKGQRHLQEHINESSVLNDPDQTIKAIYRQVNYDFGELWNSVKALTYSLGQQRQDKEALSYHLIIQRMIEAGDGPEGIEDQQLIMADTKAETADCYYGLTRYEEAYEEYSSSLKIRSRYLPKDHELLAKLHFCVGRCYIMIYDCEEAEYHLLKALQVCHNHAAREMVYSYYGDVVHSDEIPRPLVGLLKKIPEDRLNYLNSPTIILAHVLWTLGLKYFYSKYYRRSFLYFDKSRKMFLELYGNKACHKDISHILYALASVSDMLHNYDDAAMYFRKSVDMTFQLYGEQNRFAAFIMHTLAINHSLIYQKFVVRAFLSLPRFDVPHTQSATAFNRFGLHLVNIGEHSLAAIVLMKTLVMFKSVAAENVHSFGYISNTLSHMALNFWKMGDFAAAEKRYAESIDVLMRHPDYGHSKAAALEIGEILQSKGLMYEHIQKHDIALQCYLDAKERFLFGCDTHNHPKILETETQISTIRRIMGKRVTSGA